jgi:hypothetical protein
VKGLAETDRLINELAEATARRINRRQAIYRGLKGVIVGTAAVSVANLGRATKAFAVPVCGCGPTASCQSHGYTCPGSGGCNTGHGMCLGGGTRGCACCVGGQWTTCIGKCGAAGSYAICTDCFLSASGCNWCDCLSKCFCTGCQTASDMRADMVHRGLVAAG